MYINNLKKCLSGSSVLILFLLLIIMPVNAQKKPSLKFNNKGEFKIVQFTDIHLKIENKVRCDSVLTTMRDVISAEKPDLVVLTGDVVTGIDAKPGWDSVSMPMQEAHIPWAVVFGNHDHEHGFTNKQLMDYIKKIPFNVSEHGPENIHGSGNYILEVKDSKGKINKALLYCFDSNAYTNEEKNEELGHYDWIRFNQIQWYRSESNKYTKKNNGKPYPALAFFHIPLPEYTIVQQDSFTIGDKEEGVASPKINSGLYNAFLESGDVMGTFCGHDHNNNYIGTLNKIALAYGCKTGRDAYGTLAKGGRVIVLFEGERKFDTWLHTTSEPKKYEVSYPDSFKKNRGKQ